MAGTVREDADLAQAVIQTRTVEGGREPGGTDPRRQCGASCPGHSQG